MKKIRSFLLLTMMCVLCFGSVVAEATTTETTQQAYTLSGMRIKSNEKDILKNSITRNGGSESSADVITFSGAGSNQTMTVDWGKFEGLEEKEQTAVVQAINDNGYYGAMSTSADTTKKDTQRGFMESIQTYGRGTALINILFGGTKPNYARAMEMYKPFESPIGTVIAVIVIFASALLVVVMALDIAYITIPWFQTNRNNKEGEGGRSYVSAAARRAVEKQNEKSGSQVLWMWAKDRFLLLFMFGLCILYLIDGSIFKIVGVFLDLASGI